ncbi:hypothetical protein EVAR_57802_1 [Eumeta japonica]|uniref:Uncharacterized protein n=1 Tax=Eumeta variegata TaxID=151549 RepID=A0A4C1Y7Z9_EUMVA|nr:hypothetical protein EVAR_57802_1 [Eumeta japonica]
MSLCANRAIPMKPPGLGTETGGEGAHKSSRRDKRHPRNGGRLGTGRVGGLYRIGIGVARKNVIRTKSPRDRNYDVAREGDTAVMDEARLQGPPRRLPYRIARRLYARCHIE